MNSFRLNKRSIKFLLAFLIIILSFIVQDINSKILESEKLLSERNIQDDDSLTIQETYCVENGGEVEAMTAQYNTHIGWVDGLKKKFCRFKTPTNNLVFFGLEALASKDGNLAATYIKKVNLDTGKLLPGPYGTINMNLCHQLRGSMIPFVTDGGYGDEIGQADLCFFGDGSSVSAWSLVYMSLGLFGNLKDLIRSDPLLIDLPDLYFIENDEMGMKTPK